MILTQAQFREYTKGLQYLAEDLRVRLANDLWTVWENTRSVEALRDACSMLGAGYAQQYHVANGSVANDLWERIFYSDTGKRMTARVADDSTIPERVRRTANRIFVEDDDEFDDDMVAAAIRKADNRIARYAREGARLSMIFNTRRAYANGAGKARYARVPVGVTTCAFCVLLASRGFVYISEETALYKENGDRFHDCCDCEVVPSFSSEAEIIGYSADEYLEQYANTMKTDSQGRVDLNNTLASLRKTYGYK